MEEVLIFPVLKVINLSTYHADFPSNSLEEVNRPQDCTDLGYVWQAQHCHLHG